MSLNDGSDAPRLFGFVNSSRHCGRLPSPADVWSRCRKRRGNCSVPQVIQMAKAFRQSPTSTTTRSFNEDIAVEIQSMLFKVLSETRTLFD